METVIHVFSLMKRKFKGQHLFEIEIFCNIMNVSTVNFDQFNGNQFLNGQLKVMINMLIVFSS